MTEPHPSQHPSKDWVALTLAIGLCTAINIIVVAVLYDAIVSAGPGLSENATQILTTVFGGIIGVLGSYIGYQTATRARAAEDNAAAVGAQVALADTTPAPPTERTPL